MAGSFPPRPPQALFERAEDAEVRLKKRAAPFRRAFIQSETPSTPPPLTRLLRSSPFRLKLYLTLMWWSGRPQPDGEHDTQFPAAMWAELLGLDSPDSQGARRIRRAIQWLHEQSFIHAEEHSGLPTRIVMLDDTGSGLPYKFPWEDKSRRYVRLPPEFWTKQWVTALSGAAIALYLILLSERGNPADQSLLWISPRVAKERYGLSEDTWTRGTQELVDQGLVARGRMRLARSSFDLKRYRNTYRIIDSRPKAEPHWSLDP